MAKKKAENIRFLQAFIHLFAHLARYHKRPGNREPFPGVHLIVQRRVVYGLRVRILSLSLKEFGYHACKFFKGRVAEGYTPRQRAALLPGGGVYEYVGRNRPKARRDGGYEPYAIAVRSYIVQQQYEFKRLSPKASAKARGYVPSLPLRGQLSACTSGSS